MDLLLTLHDSDIYPDATNLDPSSFSLRQAARAVVVNNSGQVALLSVGSHAYHKLPGGGVEAGEDMQKALQRELLEEIGCKAEIIGEVGEIVEYRDKWKEKQISHCYLARQIGPQQTPAFTEKELNDGFAAIWANNIDEAIRLLQSDKPQSYEGLFIKQRDLTFLQTAKSLLL